MKLLLDQGIPTDCAHLFQLLGYACHHVSQFGMQKARDEEILARAAADGSVIITLDADFHMLVAVRGLSGPSVIRLRREGCKAEEVVEIIKHVLVRYRDSITQGCLLSVNERRATFRMLPIERTSRQ